MRAFDNSILSLNTQVNTCRYKSARIKFLLIEADLKKEFINFTSVKIISNFEDFFNVGVRLGNFVKGEFLGERIPKTWFLNETQEREVRMRRKLVIPMF